MEAIDASIVLEFLRLPARMERRSQFGRFLDMFSLACRSCARMYKTEQQVALYKRGQRRTWKLPRMSYSAHLERMV